ncbi:PH domain-containing protein [Methylovulum psychrotolerans]|uniref:PH domain-containing protein n=1 Tax=Methylovulum psychrotolerans TaxID=1704499 RepID=UPI001BFF1838|nr:PH domain-containing protein [Methylovulum psychrotolerans]MBT9096451.1 PH domain-containing protein [Methylovulum psychrotolerans]
MSDKSIWKSGVSQTVNFVPYIFCALFIGLLSLGIANTSTDDYTENPIPTVLKALLLLQLAITAWTYSAVRGRHYELTEERFKERSGVFNIRYDELELYRVKDITFMQPFFLRLFGRATIMLHTQDTTTPVVLIRGIPLTEARWLHE